MPVRRGGDYFPRQSLRMSGQGHNAAVFAPHIYNPGWGLNVLLFDTCLRAVSWKMSALGGAVFSETVVRGVDSYAGCTRGVQALPCPGTPGGSNMLIFLLQKELRNRLKIFSLSLLSI